jgi:hypothetical protein
MKRSSTGVRSTTSQRPARCPGGKVVVTTELIAAEGCTRVRVRGKPVEAKFAHRVTAPLRERRLRRAYERLGALFEEGGDAR